MSPPWFLDFDSPSLEVCFWPAHLGRHFLVILALSFLGHCGRNHWPSSACRDGAGLCSQDPSKGSQSFRVQSVELDQVARSDSREETPDHPPETRVPLRLVAANLGP